MGDEPILMVTDPALWTILEISVGRSNPQHAGAGLEVTGIGWENRTNDLYFKPSQRTRRGHAVRRYDDLAVVVRQADVDKLLARRST